MNVSAALILALCCLWIRLPPPPNTYTPSLNVVVVVGVGICNPAERVDASDAPAGIMASFLYFSYKYPATIIPVKPPLHSLAPIPPHARPSPFLFVLLTSHFISQQ